MRVDDVVEVSDIWHLLEGSSMDDTKEVVKKDGDLAIARETVLVKVFDLTPKPVWDWVELITMGFTCRIGIDDTPSLGDV
jgi:hypothetical protein